MFALSLPFIVAMTLPMAVLLAVLYAFSHLAADNEITAMRASGISVYQVLVPVLAWGVFMSAFNFAFVDQVLPRSNARLRGLLIDIGRKKPTFELREQVINEVPPSQYFLRASRIDAATGRLRGGHHLRRGRRGQPADHLRRQRLDGLRRGPDRPEPPPVRRQHPPVPARASPLDFQLTYFKVNDIRVKNVYDELERNTTESVRGDREMSTCEMLAVIRDADDERAEAGQDRRELLVGDLRALLALPADWGHRRRLHREPAPAYCGWIDRCRAPDPPKTAEAAGCPHSGAVDQQGASRGRRARAVRRTAAARPKRPQPAPSCRHTQPRRRAGDPHGQKRPSSSRASRRPAARLRSTAGAGCLLRRRARSARRPVAAAGSSSSNWAQVATAADRATDADRRADRFAVEVHKKWAISFACVSFVIVGIVMALRFPRGGIGLVIGGGLLVFSIHYVGLTAGESLADRGLVSPWLAMWTPNIVLTVLGHPRTGAGEPRIRLDPRRRLPGDAGRRPSPVPPAAPAAGGRRRPAS